MSQLADESHLEFFDRCGPQCTLCVFPEAGQKCLVTSCIADVDEVTPEGHLGRSEQHGLFAHVAPSRSSTITRSAWS